ncbi:MAG: hypothetical protein GY933_00605 [Hyphomicrobiales bacterium]|nr:hypothetical protein [Hyphomicrobiales bacterium]
MTEIATLYEELLPAAVDRELLESRYPAMIGLAREVLGVYANGFSLMEIWPVGFRTYNLIVPNFTNIPFSLFGLGPPRDLLGLAMFEASRTAGCAYCTANSCTFALRRGARPQDMTCERSERSITVARLAEGLSRVPADLAKQDLDKVREFVSDKDAEWLALGVAMMGFFEQIHGRHRHRARRPDRVGCRRPVGADQLEARQTPKRSGYCCR